MTRRLCFLLLLLLSCGQLYAQHNPHLHACGETGCMGLIGLNEQHDSFIPPPDGFVPYASRDVVISVTYNGFTPDAQAAFQYAVDIWASQLTSNVPIIVEANWEDIAGNTLGFAGPTALWQNFDGAPQTDTFYPSPLADKLYGADLDPGEADILATFDSGTDWYLGVDGNPGAGQYDFVSVVLHELGHGLGVTGTATVDGTDGLFVNPYSIYDLQMKLGDGTGVTSILDPADLYDAFTGDDLFWGGAQATGNNGGENPKMYAPMNWQQGSSYAHVDEATYPVGSGNSLMTPFIAQGEAIHDPGPIILGLMEDIGWTPEEVDPECDQNEFTLELQLDCWASTISWVVEGEDGTIYYDSPDYENDLMGFDPVYETFCLPEGCFMFRMYDIIGDGLSGDQGECNFAGTFSITDEEGNTVVELVAPDFEYDVSYPFCTEGFDPQCSDPEACNFNEGDVSDFNCLYPDCNDPNAINYEEAGACYDDAECVFWVPEEVYMYIEVDSILQGLYGGYDLTNQIVYRVYLHLGTGHSLGSIYSDGEDSEQLNEYDVMATAPCGCFQSEWGGLTSENVNCNLFPVFPESEFDSYLTIGDITTCTDDVSMETFAEVPDGPDIPDEFCGVALDEFIISSYLPATNGLADENGDVMVGQFTTCGALTFSACFRINVASTVFYQDYFCFEETYIPVIDCMDPEASNYNPDAIVDDGSCVYDVAGCINPEACNYNAEATVDDGSCDFTCLGCTDDSALNYNPEATLDDGSCIYECLFPEVEIVLSSCEDDDGMFDIELDVSDVGNAGPYAVTNSINGNEQTLATTGMLYIGSFDMTDEVDLNFQSETVMPCSWDLEAITCPVGIQSMETHSFSVYPNPANDEVWIRSTFRGPVLFQMVDVTGKQVLRTQEVMGQSDLRLPLHNLTSGIYFLQIEAGIQRKQLRLAIR